jgi:hypothetical protein
MICHMQRRRYALPSALVTGQLDQETHRAGPCGPARRQRAALQIDLAEVAIHAESHLQFIELLIESVAR